ncbi:GNAT family N-acetyltransferase [Nocardioides sp. zg-1228]|uniref:GNAT family N-acetyltransferase n=1 Tax=Nocardioides sp. zg-1228 TaxID=2763008 RepID=UPI001643351F|nr:GNAT family N-acetyltransferase [Nocardioides sp. zg-1228]MBC2932578.1 GNAT family N-acetyltransferase [Nocardioides sp. zg-1228]QSF58075.1 GNAT family N-acetyltransferase [Nocardioides sp. zg-1228]
MRVLVAGVDELPARLAYDVWRLRQEVFVVEQDCPYPDLDGRDLEAGTRHVVLLDEGDEVVGTLRVLEDGDALRIGRVVVAATARGRGLAALMMDEAIALCADRAVRLAAQAPLADFYAAWGFEVAGPEFDEDGIRHVPMRRAGREQARPQP